MREMVLHHASLRSPGRHAIHTIIGWLKDVSTGMASLVSKQIAKSSLRMRRPMQEIHCLPDYSLFDACQDLRKEGARDEYGFLIRLSAKCPLLNDVEFDIEDRFRACEAKELPSEDGEPLVLCAITDWIAVGFPSDPVWDGDCITVSFNELLPDESIEEASEKIDNLSRSVHARSIYARHREDFLRFQNPSTLWEHKHEVFPNLVFGPDVERPSEFFCSIVKKLTALDESAAAWRKVGGTVPPWTCKVTPESEKVKNDRSLLDARRFRSQRGTTELFEWHARVGSGFRIHLRFDAHSREIEIGYIGPHLPL